MMQRNLKQVALRTTLLYGFFAALWIVLSDRVVVTLVSDPIAIGHLSTYKGWFFVFVTASLLYITLRNQLRQWEQEAAGRKQAEETLRRSEERYRAVVEGQTEIISRFSEDGTLTFVNEVYCRFFGKTRDDLIGKKWQPAAVPEDIPGIEEQLRTLSPVHPVITHENRVWSGSGDIRWMQLVNQGFFNDEGRLVEIQSVGRDITGRKQMEEVLREYERVIENSRDMIAVVDQDYKYVLANGRFLKYRGLDREQVIGRSVQDVLGGDIFERVIKKNIDACFQGETVQYEMKLVYPELGERDLLIRHFPVENPEGIRRIVSIIQDITDHKRAEEVLHLYGLLSEHSRDIILSIRYEDGRILEANAAAAKAYGYSHEELLGLTIHDLCAIESRGVTTDQMAKADTEGLLFETVHQRKDNSTFPVEVSSQGATIGGTRVLISVIREITERKRAEEALRENEAIFSSFLEHSPVYVFFKDKEIRSLRLSKNYEHILRMPVHQALGKTMDELFPSDLAKSMIADDLRILEEGKRVDVVEELNGRIYETTKFPILKDDKPFMLAGFTLDITERKRIERDRQRLEERLGRAEKMEALGALAGGVAHDMNNVLGVLVGYSELLLMEIPEGNPLRRHVSNILQSGQRGSAIIQDLLTMARRGVAISEIVNLNHVISGHLKTPEFEKLKSYHPQVTFKTDLNKDLMNIKGSTVHLSKTIMNLLSNAAEAINDHGEVTVVTENHYLDRPITGYDQIQEGDYVVLRISDNGKGISTEDLGKIFEPFYTKKIMGRSGTGLGLAIVWGTVKDHGGYIDVQSEEGKGSTFRLYFPVTREEIVSEQEGVSPESYRGRGESIVVVDDVREQRELATAMLSRLGYQVNAVSSGEGAVTYLKTNRVDMLVLDMIMDPGMDGLETYQRVLEINPKQKAIIVSGFSETDRVKKAQELGAGAYVRKPYILEKIGLAIRRELDRS